MNVIFPWKADRTSTLHGRWTEHPLFTGNGQNNPLHGRWTEHPLSTDRTSPLHRRQTEHPQNQPRTDNNDLSAIGINFSTPYPTT